MRIIFTGGGTGGHFYPIIAIAEEINTIAAREHILDLELYYMAATPYDANALYENNITFKKVSSGKIRRYFSILNVTDVFKTTLGVLKAIWQVFWIYPDVVVGRGGYMSFPAIFAARLLHIPVVIHETDSLPGRVNAWAGKFAEAIAISYPETATYFKGSRGEVVVTGSPVRKEILTVQESGAYEFLGLSKNLPIIYVTGGSLGAQQINNVLLDSLPELLTRYQIIHQTGKANIKEAQGAALAVITDKVQQDRYRAFDYLNNLALRMTAGVATLVISRAGSTVFEIANWGIPSIIIPIPEDISHDQRSNAFAYARSGAAIVIEEKNLTPHILVTQIDELMRDENRLTAMSAAAKGFAHIDAANKIARKVLDIALRHEK